MLGALSLALLLAACGGGAASEPSSSTATEVSQGSTASTDSGTGSATNSATAEGSTTVGHDPATAVTTVTAGSDTPTTDTSGTGTGTGASDTTPSTDSSGTSNADSAAAGASAAATDTAGTTQAADATTTTATASALAATATWHVPTLPARGLTASQLAVIVAEGDALSEAVAAHYQQARGIPAVNIVRVKVDTSQATISSEAFTALRASVEAQLGEGVQATLLTWAQPSRVVGSCTMSITSAMARGWSAAMCGGCARTTASPYYDTETTRPWQLLGLRPSMLLGATTLEAAKALIDRGVAADGTLPAGTGYLVRTSDSARSVRWADFQNLPVLWSAAPALDLRYQDNSAGTGSNLIAEAQAPMFYFTGLASVGGIDTQRWRPGAWADHLTSFGGVLPGGNGQMPATRWLAAGATGSYGTVEEPCNWSAKFPRASVLIDQYLRGATLIEAAWKSVQWPGQGLFVGEPLARPWPDRATMALADGGRTLVISTRGLRRGSTYQVQARPTGSSSWQTLKSLKLTQPAAGSWRITLPEGGGDLRWVGPCETAAGQTCVLATGTS